MAPLGSSAKIRSDRMNKTKDKTVLITGALGGIGRAIAIEFAKQGANLILHYKDTDEADADKFGKSLGVRFQAIRADFADEQQILELAEKAGPVDILVNCAGIVFDRDFNDITLDEFNQVLKVNLIAPFVLSRALGKKMFENKYGKIVNIASTNGTHTLYPETLDYDASKSAVISLTKNLAKQFAPFVNVNAVAPGWVNTPMNKGLPPEFVKEEIQRISLGRFAEPEEIAKIVRFLCSDDASYIDGATIIADGQTI